MDHEIRNAFLSLAALSFVGVDRAPGEGRAAHPRGEQPAPRSLGGPMPAAGLWHEGCTNLDHDPEPSPHL